MGDRSMTKPIIAGAKASAIMTSTPDREKETVFSGEVYGSDYISDIDAPSDEARALVNHPVVDLTGIVVGVIVRLDTITPQTAHQGLN